MKGLFIFLVFVSSAAWSYTPTLQALFKNGHNADISATTVELSTMVKTEKSETTPEATVYVKLTFFGVGTDSIRLLQSMYSGSEMNAKELRALRYIPDLQHTLSMRKDNGTRLYFNMLFSNTLNMSFPIMAYLKSIGFPVYSNLELVNNDKVALIQRYKTYLASMKQNPKQTELANPLKGDTAAERETILNLLNSSHYKDAGYAHLVRRGKRFFWDVTLPNLEISFTNMNHRLKRLYLHSAEDTIEFNLTDYTAFDGVHEAPKFISAKINADSYILQTLSLKHSNAKDVGAAQYQKLEEILKKRKSTLTIPSFLLTQ